MTAAARLSYPQRSRGLIGEPLKGAASEEGRSKQHVELHLFMTLLLSLLMADVGDQRYLI